MNLTLCRCTRSWRYTRLVVLFATVSAAAACLHTRGTAPPTSVPATKPDHELGAETGTPVSSTPSGLMHDGAEAKIQAQLRKKGLLTAEQCTGRLDPDTRDALREFQKSEGLPTTGLPSYETVNHLGLKLETIFRSMAHSADPPPTRPRPNG